MARATGKPQATGSFQGATWAELVQRAEKNDVNMSSVNGQVRIRANVEGNAGAARSQVWEPVRGPNGGGAVKVRKSANGASM